MDGFQRKQNMGVCFKIVPPKPIWLVVSTYPSEKWWTESQLGLWHSQYDGKVNPNSMVPVSTNQQWFNGQSSCSYEMAGRISPMYPISKKTPVKWWWKSDPSTEVQKAGKIHRSAAVGCPARWLIAGGYHALHWVIKTWLSTISYDYHKFNASLVDYLSIMSLVDYPLVN